MSEKIITLDNLARFKEKSDEQLANKQDALVSGETIKTINNQSILGSGNIEIGGGGSSITVKEFNETDITPELLQEIYNEVPEILRVNSTQAGIQDYGLKVNDKNNSNYISYTCVIGGTEFELRFQDSSGSIALSTNQLNFLPSRFVDHLYTSQEVDSLLNNKQDTLVSGTNIKTINNESILGEGNIDIQGGNVSDLYLELEGEPTQAQLEQIYTQKPDVLRLGMGGSQHVVVLHKSLQSESETRLNYFNIQNGAGDIQVLKIEYSEGDGYVVEPYEWSLDNIVSGTNDGTNWTSLTINGETHSIPQGGGSSTDVQINGTSITSDGVADIVTTTTYDAENNHIATMSDIPDVSTKQETLVSGQNIKTINGTSLLGSGDITVSSVGVDKFLSNAQLVSSGSSTTEETVTFSALDTANANFSLLNNNRSFWTTYDAYMEAIHGSKLEEITLNVGQAGSIRIYGYDTAISYSQTNNQLASAAASADTNGYLIMTIDAVLGIETYKLDGTDSRVTISSQTAIDSCPPCLGFSRTGDTGLMKYNNNNITGEPYRHWAHAGLSGTVIETPDPTNALPIVFKILKTSTDPNAKLVFTMNDSTTYEITLGSVDIAPVLSSVYKGKKLSILGDSISTYQNQIPSGNPTYYPRGDVNSPDKTWWKKLADALGMTILVNNSWSGSMVTTNNGDAGAGCLTRCQSLHSGSTNPDVIIVWLGINDFNNEVALGTYDGKSVVPTDTTTFREAYGMMLNKILTRYKTSEVWVCTLPQMERNNDAGFPEINENGVPLKDFNDAIVELADAFGVKVLDHNKAGMTYQNMDTYTVDWDSSTSKGLHPNDAGHSLIANNDIRQMDNVVRTRY